MYVVVDRIFDTLSGGKQHGPKPPAYPPPKGIVADEVMMPDEEVTADEVMMPDEVMATTDEVIACHRLYAC